MVTEEKITNKKILFKILITLTLIICIILLLQFAWARYIKQINGKAQADIAKFNFNVTVGSSQNLNIDLGKTRTGVIQEANVQESYVGPGTAGKFDIVVNASGSETSLEYDINLNVDYSNNEVFPKNLIFYFDEGMKNAIYHENNVINLNRFVGWNGKNHFDERNWLLAIKNAIYDVNSGHYIFRVNEAHNLYGNGIPFRDFKENTQYTYTIIGYVEGIEGNDNTLKFYFTYTDGTKSYKDLRSKDIIYTSTEEKTIEKSFLSWNTSGVMVYISHIQLEEGAMSTEFEPYIISMSTKVTQDKKHTLTALWEKVDS